MNLKRYSAKRDDELGFGKLVVKKDKLDEVKKYGDEILKASNLFKDIKSQF